MPVQETRLRDDLRGLIKGDVQTDEVVRQLFASDSSILQACPICVVNPRNTDDVIAVVKYASEEGIPIHARGAGTSLTGESLGEGIVLVFSRYMRQTLHVGDDFVTVQPGLLRCRLNGAISHSQKRCFGPSAGNVSSASLGSILSRNGAGFNYLRYGLPSDHLLSMSVVLANGDLLKLDRQTFSQPIQEDGSVVLAHEIAFGKEYVYASKIVRFLENRTNSQRAESAHQLAVSRSGYAGQAVIQGYDGKNFDLARIFLGSEGTLGLIVEATLRTVSLPQRQCAAVFFFDSLSQAVEAVSVIQPLRPVQCEMIDRRRLNMVRDWDARYFRYIPSHAEAALLVELDAGTLENPSDYSENQERLQDLIDLVHTKERLCFQALKVNTEEDFTLFDGMICRSELALGRLYHSIQSLPLFDDVAVPIGSMNRVISDLLALLHRYKVTASFSGHAGQGHIRIHPLIDLSHLDIISVLSPLAEDVYALILQHGGTISSEWGTGLLKSLFLPRQFPHLFPLFRVIKETFDPQYLLNPGHVIPSNTHWTQYLRHGLTKRGLGKPNPRLTGSYRFGILSQRQNLAADHQTSTNQTATNQTAMSPVEIQLRWDPSYIFEPAYQCNGCGECLQYDQQSRGCPLYRGTARIEYAPRSKSDLMRGVLEKDIDLEMLIEEKAKEIADTCFQCRMCDIECPAKIDMNVLSFRSKAAYVAAHGLSLSDLMISRLDSILQMFTPISFLFNGAMRNRVIRWILEKTFRLPQRRIVPSLVSKPFLHRVRWTPWRHRLQPDQTDKERVVLFVDMYTNYFDPQLAELAVRILEYNGCSVHIPLRQRSSGIRSFAVGHAERAEKLVRQNTAQMLDLIRGGYTIITLEPTTASCFTKDYQHMIERDEAELLVDNVFDFCDFLLQLHHQGMLQQDWEHVPFRAGYHAPCRALALSASLATDATPAESLLRLIPGLDVHRVDRGCCGMAGFWGIHQKNYRNSLKIGMPLFRVLRQPEIDFGISECSSCCSQMILGSQKPAFHPIRLLAAAYGFLPVKTLGRKISST